MFRKGGSADGGITSGLQRPGYNVGNRVKEVMGEMESIRPQRNTAKRRLGDLMIDFGIDIASRTPTGSGIGGAISTTLASLKDPFDRFKASRASEETSMNTQADNLDTRRAGMFKSLIEGQSDILAEKSGNTSYKDLEIARALEDIMPRFIELREKRENNTLEEGEDLELRQLQEKYNTFQEYF